MVKALVIVESPAKAKTISKYLGEDFIVESSIGHVRDLPGSAAEIPARYKKEAWARLGVNVDKDFEPLYVVPQAKKAQIEKLKKALAKVDALYLATDEDREGEAIAWHLQEVLKPTVPVKRMVFGEITKAAIQRAVDTTREIDQRMVQAQEARRVLDRLYGYEVSPVLWRKVKPRLSAGRVQSVATRLIVERERTRMRFISAEYWDLEALLEGVQEKRDFTARLVELGGKRVASGRDFDDETGSLTSDAILIDDKRAAALTAALEGQAFKVTEVKEKPFTRKPYPPFITSTLQQEAAKKLRFTTARTMRVAQGLYENGFITYMRTDSTQLSAEAVEAARSQIGSRFGGEYVPGEARVYPSRSKNAQEAHEAIRPAGSTFRAPDEVKDELHADAFKLYELIWRRTIASQMKNAEGTTTSARIQANPVGEEVAVFGASGRVIRFDGFLKVYVEEADEPKGDEDENDSILPALGVGDSLPAKRIEPLGHSTQPRARFTEASLVKELEERGIGRPSTYASIIQTIQDRGYVWKKGSALVPTFTAFAVTRLLEKHLSELVDFDFTARMEDDLDSIARGDREARPWLHEFYFGPDGGGRPVDPTSDVELGLKDLIGTGWEAIDARQICSVILGKNEDGEEIAARVGRYGAYLQIGDTDVRAQLREDVAPEEMTLAVALELLEKAKIGDLPLGQDPATGLNVYAKTGRFGDYVQLGDPELDSKGKIKKDSKPKMASIWPGNEKESVTLDDALLYLSFPRELGVHPETKEMVTVHDGRFGPYLKMAADSRSLENHEQMATMDLEKAIEIYKKPKERGRRSQAILKEVGKHPETDLTIQLKDGRFGPYVTDGVVNASVPKGRDPMTMSFDDALELIAAREQKMRDMGLDPRAKKTAKKKAEKSPAKKKTAKKAAKKKTTKKAAKKKAAKKVEDSLDAD